EAAGDRRRGPARDRLFVLLPWLSQMNVNVDESRRYQPPSPDLEHVRAVHREISADPRDGAVIDQNVEFAIAAIRRIDDASALQKCFHRSVHIEDVNGIPS